MNKKFRLADTNGDLFNDLPMEVQRNWIGFQNLETTWSVNYRGMRDRHWDTQQEAMQAKMVYERFPQAFDLGRGQVRYAFEQLFHVPWN